MDQHKILIVDDEEDILEEYGGLFEAYPVEVITNTDPQKAIDILKSQPITVLVTDHKMPRMTGLQLVEQAKEVSPDTIRLILTGYAEQDMMLKAINVGQVFRFLIKPCDPEEFVSIVMDAVDYFREREKTQKLIGSRDVYKDAKSDLEILHTQLEEREAEIQMLLAENEKRIALKQENFKTIFSFLASLIKIKNQKLFQNGQWVAEFSTKIATMMNLPEQEKNAVRIAAYLKNIGLILLPDIYTEKPLGMFSHEELKQYYRFPILGEQVLKRMPGFGLIAKIIGYQLEHFDGSGPRGVCGTNIPLPSRIISVADDTYRILFSRAKEVERETVYGHTFMINHLRKNLKKLYDVDVALATIKILEKGS